ncbi:MAG: GNAT family N-acetyltransferase [Flavobacteriaceae bacterium]|nr:GNAT family N-acetyltransferase [Flavobacteriaceae bacterium]
MDDLVIRAMRETDWFDVSRIYEEGMNTGIATFETEIPAWLTFDSKFIAEPRLVAEIDGNLIGFAVLSKVSSREVYSGVAEVTVYVERVSQGRGYGKELLNALIRSSESHGFWSLQASIFPQNEASIGLHLSCGFRQIGFKEGIGSRHGRWYDNLIFERRSKLIGIDMNRILVLCTGNSCRSQMAHGYLEHLLDKNSSEIYSAGIETHGLNPGAVSIMKEDGIDISGHTSNHIDDYLGIDFDYIITVCDHAHENCPYIPSKSAKRLHHDFFDPSKVKGTDAEVHDAFQKARNEIKTFVREFIATHLN